MKNRVLYENRTQEAKKLIAANKLSENDFRAIIFVDSKSEQFDSMCAQCSTCGGQDS